MKVAPISTMRGFDLETPQGKQSFNAGADGLIEVNDTRLLKQLKKQGFVIAGGVISSGGYACKCGFNSVFKKCSRCGEING